MMMASGRIGTTLLANRWLREWLPSLNLRQKWFKMKKDVKPRDVVLVVSPDTVSGH